MIKTASNVTLLNSTSRVNSGKRHKYIWSLIKSSKCHKSGQQQIMRLRSPTPLKTYVMRTESAISFKYLNDAEPSIPQTNL